MKTLWSAALAILTGALMFVDQGSTLAFQQACPPPSPEKSAAPELLLKRSKNKEPKLVVSHALMNLGTSHLPLFPVEFDWNDQTDVFHSVRTALKESETIEGWDKLLEQLDDKNYCITFLEEGLNTSPENYTVGQLAREIAFYRLHASFPTYAGWKNLKPNPIGYELNPTNDLKAWRKANTSKQLYELQIEVGRLMLKSLEEMEFESPEDRGEAASKITSEIKILQEEKKPRFGRFLGDGRRVYKPSDAEKIRAVLKTGK